VSAEKKKPAKAALEGRAPARAETKGARKRARAS